MSAETVTKKRGRPKKTDKVNLTSGKQDGEIITTPKRSTTSRSMSTAKFLSQDAVLKKPARRKKLVEVDDTEAANEQLADEIKPRKSAKGNKSEELSASRVLYEAKAFEKLKASTNAPSRISAAVKEQPEVPSSSTGSSESSVSPPSTSLDPAQNTNTSESSLPSTNPSSSTPPTSASNDTAHSSFLSSFLSDTPDPIPEAPESSKFSDRSAFSSQSESIDEIVSGAGISDLTSLTAAIQQKVNAKRERESSIPITAPKSFKSHSLNSFPDKAQQQKVKAQPAQKYVNPETYALGSFQKFKDSAKANTVPSTVVLKPSSANPSATPSPKSHQQAPFLNSIPNSTHPSTPKKQPSEPRHSLNSHPTSPRRFELTYPPTNQPSAPNAPPK